MMLRRSASKGKSVAAVAGGRSKRSSLRGSNSHSLLLLKTKKPVRIRRMMSPKMNKSKR